MDSRYAAAVIPLFLLSTALADDGALAVTPFGIALFAWGHPVRGTVYAGTQLAGIGGAVAGGLMAEDAAEAGDTDAFATAQLVVGASVAVATTSYLASLVDGSRVAELRAAGLARRASVTWYDEARAASAAAADDATRPSGASR